MAAVAVSAWALMDPKRRRRYLQIVFGFAALLVAIVFLLFDVELLFLYPWAVGQWSVHGTPAGTAPAFSLEFAPGYPHDVGPTADAATIDAALILGSEGALMKLSETIDSSHLTHNERSEAVWEALA